MDDAYSIPKGLDLDNTNARVVQNMEKGENN